MFQVTPLIATVCFLIDINIIYIKPAFFLR
jgi:hypothetical protein